MPATLGLSLGPLRLLLEGSEQWIVLARHRYGSFAFESSGATDEEAFDVRIRYRALGNGPSTAQIEAARATTPNLSPDGGGWLVQGPCLTGRLEGRLLHLEGPLATFPLDSALVALWSLFEGDVILHGALAVEGDLGWLCTGPSGVGKSTLARLLPERVLCDELVGLGTPATTSSAPFEKLPKSRRSPVAHSLPFYPGRPGKAEVVGVHFLEHGSRPERHRLSPSEAFARLREQAFWPCWSESNLERAFSCLAELATKPCWRLVFRPDPDVWPVLSAPEAA